MVCETRNLEVGDIVADTKTGGNSYLLYVVAEPVHLEVRCINSRLTIADTSMNQEYLFFINKRFKVLL